MTAINTNIGALVAQKKWILQPKILKAQWKEFWKE